MSVLIRGMEMPTSCCACPLFKSNMSKQLFCKAFGAFDKSYYDKLPIERMKNCPLVPVPPHGRLVDADRLLSEQMKQKYYHLPNGDTAIPIIDIEHATTIIETEEVYGQYTDTAGNFHWCGTHSGEHKIKAEEGE